MTNDNKNNEMVSWTGPDGGLDLARKRMISALLSMKCLEHLGYPVCEANFKIVQWFEGDLARHLRKSFESQLCHEDSGYNRVHLTGTIPESIHISRFSEYIDTKQMVKDMRETGEILLVDNEGKWDELWLLNPNSGCYLKDEEQVKLHYGEESLQWA